MYVARMKHVRDGLSNVHVQTEDVRDGIKDVHAEIEHVRDGTSWELARTWSSLERT